MLVRSNWMLVVVFLIVFAATLIVGLLRMQRAGVTSDAPRTTIAPVRVQISAEEIHSIDSSRDAAVDAARLAEQEAKKMNQLQR